MEFKAIIRVELSYWLIKHMKDTGKSPQNIAEESKVPISEVKKAMQRETVMQMSMESICTCIHRPFELLGKPPVDHPVFLCFTKTLTKEYRNLRKNKNSNKLREMVKNISQNYAIEDIERISAWLHYLVSNPDSAESRGVVEPIMDMEEQLRTRSNWLSKFKVKVRNIGAQATKARENKM